MVRIARSPPENLVMPAFAAQVNAKKARYLAMHDELTLLPNREYFGARLEFALDRAAPLRQALAVFHLSMNLEDFKRSSDAYGGADDDELLRRISARLALAPRAEDMPCRLKDDQFACLVPGLSKREQLSNLASRLSDAVSLPLRIGMLQFRMRPSIGIATYPVDGANAELLLANAECAMRSAKRRDASFAFVDEG
jgi:diguanylate cyclase (GGDEF)-like protein